MNEKLVKITQLDNGYWKIETQFATAVGKRRSEALVEVGIKAALGLFAVQRTLAAINEMIADEVKDMKEA